MSADTLESHDFAMLAKRIAAWTTNSLLTLMVLVAGLGFGRQVLIWWGADSVPIPATTGGTAEPGGVQTMRFGDSRVSLGRRLIVGDKDKAAEQLREQCREVLENVTPANLSSGKDGSLTFLAGSMPVEEEPGKWRLYELRGAFPMVVGVARTTAGESLPDKSDLSEYSVAVWGLAVPGGDKQWTLNTFQSDAALSANQAALRDIPLPPGGKRTLSLSSSGGGIVAFDGTGGVADWKQFYDDWFSEQQWQAADDWRAIDSAWHARFSTFGDYVDIRLGSNGRGGLSGVLMITRHELR